MYKCSEKNNTPGKNRVCKPSFTFFDRMKCSLLSIKFINEKKDKITMIEYIINNLIFEKYNTKYNYFFVSDLFNKLCIVD